MSYHLGSRAYHLNELVNLLSHGFFCLFASWKYGTLALVAPSRLNAGTIVVCELIKMVILGINSAFHESSAALIVDGSVIAAVEEERLNRIKHGKVASTTSAAEVPWRSIQYCLSAAGFLPHDIDHVAYSFDPWKRRNHKWFSDAGQAVTEGDFGTLTGEESFFQSNIRARKLLEESFTFSTFHFVDHHLSHAASACLTAPFNECAYLVADGIGEFESTSYGYCEGNRITTLGHIDYPNSLGFLWEKISEFLGFSRYDGPGQVMALGTATHALDLAMIDRFLKILKTFVKFGGLDFTIDNNFMQYRTARFTGFEDHFGSAESVRSSLLKRGAIAAALQRLTEEILCSLANALYSRLASSKPNCANNLALAGGVFLNCAANAQICRRSQWKQVWTPPSVTDSGTAIGAALWLWYDKSGQSGDRGAISPYLGPQYSDEDYSYAARRYGLELRKPSDLFLRVSDLIARGKIVAWVQGRCEFGPRALGNRSLLANPGSLESRALMNEVIKQRLPFRPFAPGILKSAVDGLFDIAPSEYLLLNFMNSTPVAKEPAMSAIIATMHRTTSKDLPTARLQMVTTDANPRFAELLDQYGRLTGVPALLNTSFNVREPIVCSPLDACKTFVNSSIDFLVLGSFLIGKE